MTNEERDEVKQVVQEVLQEEGVAIDDNTIFPMKNSAGQSDALLMMQLDQQHHATDYSRINAENLPEGGGGSITIDPVPTEDSTNAVSSGGTYNMIVNTAATLFGDIQNATNINALESADGKIYNDYQAGDIFFITDNNIRKYRVALVAGTADAEHPVTISPVNFYYALNSVDAINLSLTLKTVSTEQQSLSSQQKAQARSNIATIGYEAQTLTTQQKEQSAQNIGLGAVVKGDVQQSLSDAEKVNAQNNMMGKAYNAAQFSGLGKKVLAKNVIKVSGVDKNVMTQAFFDTTNTVYVVQYDYTLGENITIPAGCTLEFDGGSISGAFTLTGNNTKFSGELNKVFGNIDFSGTFDLIEVDTKWFKSLSDANALKVIQPLISNSKQKTVYIRNHGYDYLFAFDSNSQTGLNIDSNTSVETDATFRVNTNSLNYYRILFVVGEENVTINGGKYIGDKATHGDSGQTSEYCSGIVIYDSSSVTVKNAELSYFPGDGVSMGKYDNDGIGAETVTIESSYIHDCGRQGISVGHGNVIKLRNLVIKRIKGDTYISQYGPGAAIDLEPNSGQTLDNVSIENVVCENVGVGINIYGRNGESNRVKNVSIIGFNSKDVYPAQEVTIETTWKIYGNHIFAQTDNLSVVGCVMSQSTDPLSIALIDLQYTNASFDNLHVDVTAVTSTPIIRNTYSDGVVTISNSVLKNGNIFNLEKSKPGNIIVKDSYIEGTLNAYASAANLGYGKLSLYNTEIKGNITYFPEIFAAVDCVFNYIDNYSGVKQGINIDNLPNNAKKVSVLRCYFKRSGNLAGTYIRVNNPSNAVLIIENNIFDMDTSTYTIGGGTSITNANGKTIVSGGNSFVNVPASHSDSFLSYVDGLNAIKEAVPAVFSSNQGTPSKYTLGEMQIREVNSKKIPVWWNGDNWVDASGNIIS